MQSTPPISMHRFLRILFSVVHDSTGSSVSLNNDLLKISQWAYQWKMIFNPDVSKQAQEVVFPGKAITTNHETVYINNVPVIRENFQKHLGLILDPKLNFFGLINEKIKKRLLKVSTSSGK